MGEKENKQDSAEVESSKESGKKEVDSSSRRGCTAVLDDLKWALRVIYSGCDRFYWDNGFSRAASLAYTSLLSLVPFTGLGFGLLASFASSKQYAEEVQGLIFRKFVPAPEVAEEVTKFLADVSAGMTAISIPMILFFLFTSLVLINSVEAALNEVWQVFEPRPIVQRVGIFCTIILAAPLLLVSALLFFRQSLQPYLGGVLLGSYISSVTPFLIMFAVFGFLFYVIPKAPVKFGAALFGAFLTGILFIATYWGFAYYIEHYATYNKLYGALASIPIFLFWLYIFWTVTLIGAEISYQAQYLPRKGSFWQRSLYSIGDAQLVLVMQVLVEVANRFREAKPMPGETELAQALGCSSVVLKPALYALRKRELIVRGEGNAREVCLAKTPEKITLEEIHYALFRNKREISYPGELAECYHAFRNGSNPATTTLADILTLTENKD